MSKLTIYRELIRPRRDHVLVKMDKPERVTKSGIIIPNNYTKESNFKGTIELVSNYDLENDTDHKDGLRVIVPKQSGLPVFFDDNFGEEYKLFNKDEVRYVF